MKPLEMSVRFALIIAVLSVVACFIAPFKSEGFYLSVASLVISSTIAIVGFIVIKRKFNNEE